MMLRTRHKHSQLCKYYALSDERLVLYVEQKPTKLRESHPQIVNFDHPIWVEIVKDVLNVASVGLVRKLDRPVEICKRKPCLSRLPSRAEKLYGSARAVHQLRNERTACDGKRPTTASVESEYKNSSRHYIHIHATLPREPSVNECVPATVFVTTAGKRIDRILSLRSVTAMKVSDFFRLGETCF